MTDVHGKLLVYPARPCLSGCEQALSEVDPEQLADWCLCFVQENRSLYLYLREGSSHKGSPEVVRPTRGAGQWERSACADRVS
jgi:hypothetical protein